MQGGTSYPAPSYRARPSPIRFYPASPHQNVDLRKPLLSALLALVFCSPGEGEETSGLETSSTGPETTQDPQGSLPTTSGDYLPCVQDPECPEGHFCFLEQEFGVCTKVCSSPENCPEIGGVIPPICAIVFLPQGAQACLLSCLVGNCPSGLDCLEYRGSLFCG